MWYNHKPLHPTPKAREHAKGELEVSSRPWQRCALVEAQDLFHAELTVEDVVTYAMKVMIVVGPLLVVGMCAAI